MSGPTPQLTDQELGIELLRACERVELLQALVLDLPDPLAREVERPADLVERRRGPAVEAVAELEDVALAVRERGDETPQRFVPQGQLDFLVGGLLALVDEEVAERGVARLTDGLLERHRSLRCPPDL